MVVKRSSVLYHSSFSMPYSSKLLSAQFVLILLNGIVSNNTPGLTYPRSYVWRGPELQVQVENCRRSEETHLKMHQQGAS